MSYTKGPWIANKIKVGNNKHDDLLIYPASYFIESSPAIAKVYCDDENDEANARLIATAPELLGSIKLLLEAFDILDDCDCGGTSTCAVCNAHTIIAKAEGKEGK